MSQPLMPKATAQWLVDNTALTFQQIADFCGIHHLEVQALADGQVIIHGFDPIANGQLTADEIARCEKDADAKLEMIKRDIPVAKRQKGPKYTPISRRQDKPDAIAWLTKTHPELNDAQISRLVGTTRPTIQAVRERGHWNAQNIRPRNPVALGLCRQMDLDREVAKANKGKPQPVQAAQQAEEPAAAPAQENYRLEEIN